ncbi:MAG: response regulator [Pseudomonadota bacterium]
MISNALKFTNTGQIELDVKTTDTDTGLVLEFSVRDNGVGIPEEDQERVFERFFTQEKSYDRMASGTGLGLAICKQIVDKMNGEIHLESMLGEGTTFFVSIPLRRSEPKLAGHFDTNAHAEQAPVKPQHVLLVEDNEINRLIVREMLEHENITVSEAQNGLEALEKTKEHKFSAILMDVSMPKMNGVDATIAIRKGDTPNKETPIVALTAHALKEEKERFLDAGMDDCLNKPVSQADLIQTLQRGQNALSAQHRPKGNQKPLHLLDPTIFANLETVLKGEKLRKLVHSFDQEITHLLDVLPDHLHADKLEDLRAICHRSVGSAGMIGALEYQKKLRALEQAAKATDLESAIDAARSATDAWSATQKDLLKRV